MTSGEDRLASALEQALKPPWGIYKGLESPVVVLAEFDGRVAPDELAALIYVGATRARAHLVVVASEALARQL